MIKRTNQTRDWILFDTVRSGGTSMDDYLTLGLLAFMGISGLTTEAGRIIVEGFPEYEKWSFVGYFIADMLPVENGVLFHRTS